MTNKYATLAEVKAYAQVTTTVDDGLLQDALDWAEGEFEILTGSQFDQQTQTLVAPLQAFVDRGGRLTIEADHLGPVTAVSAIQYLLPFSNSWTTLTWDATNGIVLPPAIAPIIPNGWRVTIIQNALPQLATDDVLWRWSFTGGYATTPLALKIMIERLSTWKYKLREAPLGKVTITPFGVTEIIPALPADIGLDISKWTHKPA